MIEPEQEVFCMKKKKIAVLFGGCSTEYQVSLQSAYAVITHINQEKYQVILIGLSKETGQWFWYQGDPQRIQEDTWLRAEDCTPVYVPTDRNVQGLFYLDDEKIQILSLDQVLPILHGKNGEDGTVQGALALSALPVLGCGVLSSAICMDKELSHRVVAQQGILVPRSFRLEKPYDAQMVSACTKSLGYPLFVKPVRSGSSYGIARVEKEEEVFPAIEQAFLHDTIVILEEAIEGREVGCAVLGTKVLQTGEVDEIVLSQGFFDFTEKYTLKTSKIQVPAHVSKEISETIKKTACVIYQALGCSGFARVDLFLTEDNQLYFNEVNTIPGFTAHSRFPNMLKAAGYTFEEIIEQILEEQP